MDQSTIATSTQVTTIGSTTSFDVTPVVAAGVTLSIVLMFILLATVVALLFLAYYKRKRSALVSLTKPHKGSDENSYASSEHSHQRGSKYSESPEPGYDVIKPISRTKNPKGKIFS